LIFYRLRCSTRVLASIAGSSFSFMPPSTPAPKSYRPRPVSGWIVTVRRERRLRGQLRRLEGRFSLCASWSWDASAEYTGIVQRAGRISGLRALRQRLLQGGPHWAAPHAAVFGDVYGAAWNPRHRPGTIEAGVSPNFGPSTNCAPASRCAAPFWE